MCAGQILDKLVKPEACAKNRAFWRENDLKIQKLSSRTRVSTNQKCDPHPMRSLYAAQQKPAGCGYASDVCARRDDGGYDLTARLFARHWGRFIAGNPTILVSNLPGAGSLVAATSFFTSMPQDGTRLGVIAGGTAIEPRLATPAPYDATLREGKTFQRRIERRSIRPCATFAAR